MAEKKVIFFDIDGTLVGYDGVMPESTIQALKDARCRGHKLIICTGRSRSQINPWILEMGFDGIVAASGAYVELEGTVLSESLIPVAEIAKVVKYFTASDTIFTFQTKKTIVTTEHIVVKMRDLFREKYGMGEGKLDDIFGHTTTDEHLELREDVEKFIYFQAPVDVTQVQKDLGPAFYVTPSSFENPEYYSGEVTLANITKAHGIQVMIEAMKIDVDNTIAFGDGPNDIEMLQFAKVGVAMGNGTDEAKAVADYVTQAVEKDGIAIALRELGIL